MVALMTGFWTVILSVALYLLYVLIKYARLSRRPDKFPPGPLPLPIIGNLHQVPLTKSFVTFHNWTKDHGSIIGVKFGPQNAVILNDYRHAIELFDRRGAKYSGRPPMHIANDIIFPRTTHLLCMNYGPEWRTGRKLLHEWLKPSAMVDMLPIQDAESTQTVYDLLETPEKWYDHTRRYSSSVILASMFGLRGARFDSPRIEKFYDIHGRITTMMELGATPPVDLFPVFKYLPDFMAPWRVQAKQLYQEFNDIMKMFVEDSKRFGNDNCFLRQLLAGQEKSGLTMEQVEYLAVGMMEAGTDTTMGALLTFLLAIGTRPEVLAKCQAEVDAEVGPDRLPQAEDLPKLKYINAAMWEVLRWRPSAAGGVPHVLLEDDWYGEYFFPKDTMFLLNSWAVHRSDEYENPEEFMPERFLKNEFGIKETAYAKGQDSLRRPSYGFGAGRRVCQAQTVAQNSMLLNMAKMVWTFDIRAPEGAVVDDSVENYEGGILMAPKKFPLEFKPRSEARANVVRKQFQQLEGFLSTFAA